MAFVLNRTASVWNRNNRNGINTNWVRLEGILKEFDGTRLIEESYNIFNKENVGSGSIDSANGQVIDNSYVNTGIIILKPNTNYVMTAHGQGAFYDASGTFTKGIPSGLTSFTTASNEHSMMLTLGSGNPPEQFMVHEGTTLKPYMEYGFKPAPLIIAPELRAEIAEATEYFSDLDSITLNRGKDFPLKSVKIGSQAPVEIANHVKNVILGAKVSGAKVGMYYRVTFVANGITSGGKERYGITVEELRISDGWRERFIFVYNDDETPENAQNANITKNSDGIDTIIVDNGEIVISLTVDRAAISNSSNPNWLNLASTLGNSPSAVIDPNTYTSF